MARDFTINLHSLSNDLHRFEFTVDDVFFKQYGQEVLTAGDFLAEVVLDKGETFIDADFLIKGQAFLVCDRSLDAFSYPVSVTKKIVFKYGDQPKEISEDIIIITREQQKLDVGQLIYEFIVLEIPMKKLHPRFQTESEDETEGKLIYSSSAITEEAIDPRWEVLRKLK